MAQVRREMAFEKAKMMAEVEQAMKEKEDALVEKITAKLQGTFRGRLWLCPLVFYYQIQRENKL